MFSNKERNTIAKFTVYYERKVPVEIETMIAYDPNMSLIKAGLSDLRGFRIPKLTISIRDVEASSNKLRLRTLMELLKTLLAERKIEHFVQIS